MKEILCPLCGKSELALLYSSSSKDAAIHMLGSSKNLDLIEKTTSAITKAWGQESSGYYHCTNCELEFGWPFLSATQDIYSASYSGSAYYEPWKWEYQITLDRLKQVIHSQRGTDLNFLEIGAGDGAFVRHLVKENLCSSSSILTTEFSDYGKQTIEAAGIPCLKSDIPALLKTENKGMFSVIFMFQVLEHLDNPKETFQILHELAARDANLFIAVPNNFHRKLYDSVGEHFDLPPVHLTQWNDKSMDFLAQNSGWKVIEHRHQPQPRLTRIRFFLSNRYQVSILKKISSKSKLKTLYKIFTAISLALLFIRYSPQVVKLLFSPTGVAQWFWLRKIR